jgi:hypothetical protein
MGQGGEPIIRSSGKLVNIDKADLQGEMMKNARLFVGYCIALDLDEAS